MIHSKIKNFPNHNANMRDGSTSFVVEGVTYGIEDYPWPIIELWVALERDGAAP